MDYIDELRDDADLHFRDWLAGLCGGDPSARAAAWGLRQNLDGLRPEVAFERVAQAIDQYASNHKVLYAAATCGGIYDDDDAIASALEMMAVVVAERGMTDAERETRRRDRIVARIRVGSHDEDVIAWLEARAATMTDAQVLRMQPFDEEPITELWRRVSVSREPQVDHWTRRVIYPGERHLVLRESLMGREHETRHSVLSAYLHVVCKDGGASEFLAQFEEPVRLAG